MKKLLIATTALVATAGVAAADVSVSGNGRMGVVYNGEDLNFSSRLRIVFTASGETDGGLTFGGSVRADNAANGARGAAGNVFISGAFGKIAMGDVVGAAEAVIGDLPEVGYSDISANDITYITGDGAQTSVDDPVMLYTYTAGDLTFAMSLSDGKVDFSSVDAAQGFSVGAKYAFGDFAVAVGYEVVEPAVGASIDHIIVGLDASFGSTDIKVFAGEASDIDFTQYGIGVTHSMDALTVHGFVRSDELAGVDVTSYAVGAAYSLGGGATIQGGIADNDVAGSDPVADLGIKFSF